MRENNLERFIKAQESEFKTALAEIKSGHKRSCWMWYIFPQIQGLGSSGTAMYYAIEDYEEAKAYIENAVTNAHLRESSEALLQLESDDATRVMGWPDDLKLRSSMTLFALAAKENEDFRRVLDKFFDGKLLIISRSFSSSLRLVLSVLSEIVFRYRFNSLNRTVSNSIRQYRITILCLPEIRDNV